jgi:hypothetical protein
MPRSFLSAFSSLIRAGTKSGPQRVIGWTTVRRLVLYYTAMVALVSLVDFSLPLPPSEKGRMLVPWAGAHDARHCDRDAHRTSLAGCDTRDGHRVSTLPPNPEPMITTW